MEFEWHEAKNQANIEKHGIDFVDACKVLTRSHFKRRSDRSDEKRWIAVGPLNDRLITVVFTRRGEKFRIISARRARTDEREEYRQKVG